MGNKKKLIKKGLIKLFPENINTFIDLFSGSAIVSMNTVANKYIINDLDSHLYDLYNLFKSEESQVIVEHIRDRIKQFGLAKERTRRIEYQDKEMIEKYKKAYMNLRDCYNSNPNVLDFYTLMFYSFSQQFRFNSKGEFNMPCGNDCFSDKNAEYIVCGCDFFNKQNVYIRNKDFRELKIDKLNNDDFVYLDPPYFNTTATYNESGGWTAEDEELLFLLCEQLTRRGIKWGMSNVFQCKGKQNEHLINWSNYNGWNVYTFDKVTYTACGKGNSNATEVFITNHIV